MMNRMDSGDEFRNRDTRRQEGAALLVSAVVLSLMSVIAFAAIRHSEQESTSSGRSRAASRAIYAADAGVQLALVRLAETPPDLDPISENLTDGALLESRTRTQGAAQNLGQIGVRLGAEGYSINIGANVANVTRVFRVNVTADSAGSVAEVEAKLSRTGADATGY
jgi:hypothetical protein